MSTLISNDFQLLFKAAVMVCGKLNIPDSVLREAKSISLHRFDCAKDQCCVFTAKIKEDAEAETQPITKQDRLEDSAQICPLFSALAKCAFDKVDNHCGLRACKVTRGKLLPC